MLDNLEQVIGAAAFVANLLMQGPHLAILVTSRSRLRIRAEEQYMLDPLPLPNRKQGLSSAVLLAEAQQSPAVALFVDRAPAAGRVDEPTRRRPSEHSRRAALGTRQPRGGARATDGRCAVASGTVTTIAGSPGNAGFANGIGEAARFSSPTAIAISPDGSFAVIADSGNRALGRLDLANGQTTIVAGKSGSPGGDNGVDHAAQLNNPTGIARANDTTTLVVDSNNNTVRRLERPSICLMAHTYLPLP